MKILISCLYYQQEELSELTETVDEDDVLDVIADDENIDDVEDDDDKEEDEPEGGGVEDEPEVSSHRLRLGRFHQFSAKKVCSKMCSP